VHAGTCKGICAIRGVLQAGRKNYPYTIGLFSWSPNQAVKLQHQWFRKQGIIFATRLGQLGSNRRACELY
jgi:hypothetical protein